MGLSQPAKAPDTEPKVSYRRGQREYSSDTADSTPEASRLCRWTSCLELPIDRATSLANNIDADNSLCPYFRYRPGRQFERRFGAQGHSQEIQQWMFLPAITRAYLEGRDAFK
ncbi:hypothetical protein AB0C02_25670 [Micromonospora sp. NPDC048999]|uniref:hypothetical protein n=1 Tax=Micromonospora sp. NPDC048999 TaxID=3155391 RepID=UPI0033C81F1D